MDAGSLRQNHCHCQLLARGNRGDGVTEWGGFSVLSLYLFRKYTASLNMSFIVNTEAESFGSPTKDMDPSSACSRLVQRRNCVGPRLPQVKRRRSLEPAPELPGPKLPTFPRFQGVEYLV